MPLVIEVEFLTGRYVATKYNSRFDAEWPPHPARLYSALVATHYASEARSPDERAALLWLEALEPPAIRASEASRREVVTVFVPVNDAGMTDVDEEARDLDAARIQLDEARAKAPPKTIKAAESRAMKAEARLAAAIKRQIAVPTRAANPAMGLAVLPEGRVRQPRTFPSVTPAEPRVTYVWIGAEPTASQRSALDGLLARLVRLGHSSSLVAARIIDDLVTPTWRPAKNGEEIFRTARAGQLEALDASYDLHREAEPRVMPARFQAYTRRAPEVEATASRSCFSEEWLVLRRVGGASPSSVACAGVAKAVRKALLSFAGTDVPEVLSSHDAKGAPSERDHLAIVPLPFVGHANASGSILGVALVLPREASPRDRSAVFAALNAWESAHRIEDEEVPRIPLTLGPAGVLELERVEWTTVQTTLRPPTWCQPSTSWSTVTPIALDRNPGDLCSRDPRKLAAAIVEAEATVRRACQRTGLPEPVSVQILPAAPWAGSAKARSYPGFPEEERRTRRVLSHVRIEFGEQVRGPVLLGAGRYFGLGLLRPHAFHD